MKKIIIISVQAILSLLPLVGFCQDEAQNLQKYWYYRHRLDHFRVIGNQPGESLLAGKRNCNEHLHPNMYGTDSRAELDFGQQRAYQGYYLGMLATEYKLLADNGYYADAWETLAELDLAIDACLRCDLCENRSPWNLTSANLDGFFMREDVPVAFCVPYNPVSGQNPFNGTNRFLDLNPQDYPSDNINPVYFNNIGYYYQTYGNPSWITNTHSRETPDPTLPDNPEYYTMEVMSKDEAINTLLGLALVHCCIPLGTQNGTREKAENLAGLIVQKMRNASSSVVSDRWWIVNPLGDKIPTDKGGYCGWYARGIAAAGNYITGGDYWDALDGLASVTPALGGSLIGPGPAVLCSDLWNNIIPNINMSAMNDHMALDLATIGKSWHNPFGINVTPLKIKNLASAYDWEPFYLLLYDVLHNTQNPFLNQNDAIAMLNAAPCSGPYKYDSDIAGGGWSSPLRFHSDLTEQSTGGWENGNYTGIDYMLMFNLYRIRFGSQIGFYIPMKNRNVTAEYPFDVFLNGTSPVIGNASNPVMVNAFNRLISTSKIHNHLYNTNHPMAGHVTFKAVKEIILRPGFVVENGSFFHAYIEPVNACNGYITSAKTMQGPDLSEKGTVSLGDDILTDEDQAILWPNPASDILNVSLRGNFVKGAVLTIYNLQDQCLRSFTATDAECRLTLRGLEGGMYILRISTPQRSTSHKFIYRPD